MNTSPSIAAAGTAALAILAGAADATAQDSRTEPDAQAAPVVVIVRVPKPWYAPQSVVVGKMRDTIPQYERLPGLVFKAYAFERESNDFGGLYFWRDRASAQAWFSSAWFERVRRERGVDAQVRTFDAPVTIDTTVGGTPFDTDSQAVATLVEIAVPAGIGRDRLVAEFQAAVPTYQKVPGLLRKHFTIAANGDFGGVYLWKDESSARAWFNEAWHGRVKKAYGQDARIEWFDTPILVPTQDASTLAAAQSLVVAP